MSKFKFCFIIAAVILLEGVFFLNNSTAVSNINNNNRQIIEDGVYTIASQINNNYVLDVAQSSKENCANVRIWENANVKNQKFKIEYLGNKYYKIISENSNKVLDVNAGGKTNGTNVQQYEYNHSDAQQWEIRDAGDGSFYFVSKCNGLFLDVASGQAQNGTNVQVYEGNRTNAQKFKLKKYEEPKQTIEDGIYTISSAANSNYVLDIEKGATNNCANVRLWKNENTSNQRFLVNYTGEGYYKITSVASGKVLDVASGGKTNGTNVQQYDYNYSSAQQWEIRDAGDENYYIVSRCNGLLIDVESGRFEKGTNIQVYEENNTNAQKFKFKKYEEPKRVIENGIYTIGSKLKSNYILDIANSSKDNCANVQLWQSSGTENQRFLITYGKNGYYKITSVYSEKVLDVEDGKKESGTNVQQYESNSSSPQQWEIRDAGDESYYIISRCNGLFLDVASGQAQNGTNVQVYEGNGTNAQKFKIEKYEEPRQTIEDGIYSISTMLDKEYVLDISEASKGNNANVQIWKNDNVAQQKFKITYQKDGYYCITNVNSRKALDVDNGAGEAGTNVQQYQKNNSAAQKWEVRDAGDGSYYVISKCNGLFLSVKGKEAKNSENIQVEEKDNSNAQKFIFNKIEDIVDIDTNKYPGYKERIEKLIELHPNWNFEFLYTGLNFSDAVAGEYEVRSANLVPTSYGGEWISGTTLYDTGWYGASEKAIARFMDPRNFLNEIDVFQFQDVNDYLYGVCTLEGIQEQVNNSFLKDYAADIDTACRNENVNPYYIIARLFQENGRNPKNGTYRMNGGDGKYYYNPFNIGATGNSTSEVYNNALVRAKREGWDTMVKALQGGIYFCKKNWLENYQNTLYQNKFDIDSTNGTSLYSHQYMQNLLGAYNEAKSLGEMYNKTGKTDSDFTFIIPLYENMPQELSPEPSNNKESYVINVRTTGTQIRIRKEASTDSEILREIEDAGTVLLSVQRGINTNWHKVITTDGLIGYMSGTYLEQIDDVKTCNYTAKVKTNDGDGCFIRIGPSTDLDKIMGLSDGTYVSVIDDSTYKNINGYDWSRIMLSNGTQAFMPSKYLAR